jgi:hypothetical protein
MNDRAASCAVSKSAKAKNCAASRGVFIIPRKRDKKGGMGWPYLKDNQGCASLPSFQPATGNYPERVGVLGLSAGARIALYAASRTDRIGAVVAEGCGYPTFEDWWSGADLSDRWWTPSIWMTYTLVKPASGIWDPVPMFKAEAEFPPRPFCSLRRERTRPATGHISTLRRNRRKPGSVKNPATSTRCLPAPGSTRSGSLDSWTGTCRKRQGKPSRARKGFQPGMARGHVCPAKCRIEGECEEEAKIENADKGGVELYNKLSAVAIFPRV